MKKLTNGLQRPRGALEPDKLANLNGNARYVYRDTVTQDLKLTDGACRLYYLLDMFAGVKGKCWPKHETLALRLNVSRSQIMRRLEELIRAGYIRTDRGQYNLTFTMGWVSDVAPMQHLGSDVAPVTHLPASDVAVVQHQMSHECNISTLLTNTEIEHIGTPAPPPVSKPEWKTCPYCKGSGHEVERFGHTVTCWACKGKKRIKVDP